MFRASDINSDDALSFRYHHYGKNMGKLLGRNRLKICCVNRFKRKIITAQHLHEEEEEEGEGEAVEMVGIMDLEAHQERTVVLVVSLMKLCKWF